MSGQEYENFLKELLAEISDENVRYEYVSGIIYGFYKSHFDLRVLCAIKGGKRITVFSIMLDPNGEIEEMKSRAIKEAIRLIMQIGLASCLKYRIEEANQPRSFRVLTKDDNKKKADNSAHYIESCVSTDFPIVPPIF